MERQIKKVVMTGGTGPVGMALIRKLLAENVRILLFQRKDSPKKKNLPNSPDLKIVDCSLEELKNYIPEETDYDVFFHLGWACTGKTMRGNLEVQNQNVGYSCDAVEVAHKMGCHTFIGAGSQAEYGRKNEPLTGDMLCEPETAYGVMKLCACYSTRILCERYQMCHIWTRILSGYGLYDNDGSVLVGNILNSLHGRKLEFSAGEQIWDFVYMDDIAEALYLLAGKGQDKTIYPIGSGEARPLKEYLQILCDKLGEDITQGLGKIPYAPDQVMHLEADSSRLTADTGWKPQVSFEEGIERVISFYREIESNIAEK